MERENFALRSANRPPWQIEKLPERHIEAFFHDCCDFDPEFIIASSDLRAGYLNWCHAHGLSPMSEKMFGDYLRSNALANWRSANRRGWRGITLAPRTPRVGKALSVARKS